VGRDPGEPDLGPFLGRSSLGESFVVVPRGGNPRLGYWTPMEREEAAATGFELLGPEELGLTALARELHDPVAFQAAALGRALRQSGVQAGRVAVAGGGAAGDLLAVAQLLEADGYELVSGSAALRRARKKKSLAEQNELRRVSAATAAAFRRVAALLADAIERDGELWWRGERLRVGVLKAEIALELAGAGLQTPKAPIVAPGEEGGVPHSTGTDERTLRAGEALIVDIFPRGRLFSDCTRTFCVGEPAERLRRAHADVRDALVLAHRGTATGMRGWSLQESVCTLLGGRGWPTPISHPGTLEGYVHNLGHGVGYELHELPSFRDAASDEDGRIESGDALTLEPGLYQPGEGGFGVRLEDLVLVAEDGLENLTPLPYDLDPRAWAR